MARRALVTGIGGQDGSYLAEELLRHGYEVFGTVAGNPEQYELLAPVRDRSSSRRSIWRTSRTSAGHSASSPGRGLPPRLGVVRPRVVGRSGRHLDRRHGLGDALLDGIRRDRPETRFVNAASAEIFGSPPEVPQRETTPIAPLTPYGAGKAFGHFLTGAFRRHYGLRASSAILFNHESPRRPPIPDAKGDPRAAEIGLGPEAGAAPRRPLRAARLGVRGRLRAGAADHGPRGAGRLRDRNRRGHTVEDFVAAAFEEVGLDWRPSGTTTSSPGSSRSRALVGDPSKARKELGWEREVGFRHLVRLMVEADLEAAGRSGREPSVNLVVLPGAGFPGEPCGRSRPRRTSGSGSSSTVATASTISSTDRGRSTGCVAADLGQRTRGR